MYCLVVLSLLVTLVTTANDAGPTAQHTLLATFGRTEVYRDPDLGLPIIRHGTAETVFTAMGYVHAVDRLWQVRLALPICAQMSVSVCSALVCWW